MPVDLCPTHYQERQRKRKRNEDDDMEPEECCEKHNKYTKRTLGLWKVETSSDAIVALAPKTYICYNLNNQVKKISCKGIQKRGNKLTAKDYKRIIQTKKPHYVINRGLRLDHKKKMRTYSQLKRGMTFLYTKRKVLSDRVSTVPLDL